MQEKSNFVDILEPRRTQTGIFRFMTRDWHPTRTQVLDKNYTPQDLKDITAQSLYLETVIEAESTKSGIDKEKLRKEVLSYIEEIGLDKKLHVIRWLGMFAIKLAFNMKIGIYVNEPAILKIKSMMGKNPVLFLPTHRSYADFCIMTYLCYHYDIQFPAVASGMDFYSMAVIGQVLRETCAFYIRRTLADAPSALYGAALRQYVRTLVTHHDAPIEFFLEGTRSRSNKSMPPKFGMLSMALAALVAREVPEVTVVPVSISYDRLMEQHAFVYEHLGLPKPKETTTGLLKWVSTLNEEFGNMYINFGEPISASEYLRAAAPPLPADKLLPAGLQRVGGAARAGVAALGAAAAGAAQAAAAHSPAHLVAAALAAHMHRPRAQPLHYHQLLHDAAWIKKVLEALGATVVADDLPGEVARVLRVHARSWALDQQRRLRLRLHRPDHTAKREMWLSAGELSWRVPALVVQLYVNPLLPRLLPPALLALLAPTIPAHSFTDELRWKYDALRQLLRHQCIYADEDEDQTFEKALEFCTEWGVIPRGEERAGAGTGAGERQAEGEREADRLRFLFSWVAWPVLTTMMLCIDVTTQQSRCGHGEALRLVQRAAAAPGAPAACVSRPEAALALRALADAGALAASHSASTKTTIYEVVPGAMAQCRALVSSVLPRFNLHFSADHPVFINDHHKSRL